MQDKAASNAVIQFAPFFMVSINKVFANKHVLVLYFGINFLLP
jgi:hypothetical protein